MRCVVLLALLLGVTIITTLPVKLALPPVAPPSRTLYLVMRSFEGHRAVFDNCFDVALNAFVDWRSVHLTIALDAESMADRQWGQELELRFTGKPVKVVYVEPPPEVYGLMHNLTGFHFFSKRYATASYHRQLYDTFMMDTFVPPSAQEEDIIGICDVDAPFMSMLPLVTDLLGGAAGTRPVLRQQTKPHDFFELDDYFINGNSSNGSRTRLYGMMELQFLPQFFFKRTFGQFRAHVTSTWRTSTFAEALIAAVQSARERFTPTRRDDRGRIMFSPANALVSFATSIEPQAYEVALVGLNRSERASPAFGFNNRCYQENISAILRPGCCRLFHFANCTVAERENYLHLMSAYPHDGGGPLPFTEESMIIAVDKHYEGVARQIEFLTSEDEERMRAACMHHAGEPLLVA